MIIMMPVIYVFQCYCTAADASLDFVSHNAQLADRMEEYVKIIYQETQGCDYTARMHCIVL